MIAVCPNPFRDSELAITRQVVDILRREGAEAVVCPVFVEDAPESVPADIEAIALESVASRCNMAVVIGGDGTLLAVARKLHNLPVPILGVNLGTKGFMCALEPGDIELVARAAKGDYTISRRMMLDVKLKRDGETIYTDCALNDAVLHGYGDCIKHTAWCGEAKIISYSGDGIILSTPTGSTGYSMSAGGPIVEPTASNIILSPICAHMMGARSYVLDPQHRVFVMTEKLHGRRAYLSVDGNTGVDLANGDILEVTCSEHCTLMVDLGLRSFFEIAFEKLV